jgi:putative addiction module antidote
MARRIFKTGNSVVVSLPADVLEAVGLALGDEVHVTAEADRQRIVITSSTLPGVRPGFLERVDRFIDDHRPALEALSKE